jgi:hypothetical protein
MPQPTQFLSQLIRSTLGSGREKARADVQVPAKDASGPAAADPISGGAIPPNEEEENARGATAAFDDGIIDVLAEKVLLAWLRNRYQLLFPFALNLRRLDRPQGELFLHAMIAAAQADGALDGKERERIEGALSLVNPSDNERALLETALARPKPLNEILEQVQDIQTGALVYAASLMAVDQRKPVNRHYLRYLAARLQLSEELVGSLEQRFHSAG